MSYVQNSNYIAEKTDFKIKTLYKKAMQHKSFVLLFCKILKSQLIHFLHITVQVGIQINFQDL